MARELRYRFECALRASRLELWPLVSDTNRFNREIGAPEVEAGDTADGSRPFSLRAAGRRLRYDEAPFEWVRPERFGVTRAFHNGPFRSLAIRLELADADDGGTQLAYEIAVTPRGPLGGLVAPIVLGRIARRRIERVFRRYDDLASGRAAPPPQGRARFAPGGRARLAELSKLLRDQGRDAGLVARLVEHVERGDETAVARMRPYALADAWGAGRRAVLELFLNATRSGLLESRWQLLCPHCRGGAHERPSLAGVGDEVFCGSCGIDYRASFERSVELVFRPAAAVREVEPRDYCLGGPGLTPHIVARQQVASGEQREVLLGLEPGAYHLRAGGRGEARQLAVARGGPDELVVTVSPDGLLAPGELLGERSRLVLRNDTAAATLATLERAGWADDAALAADVTALQAFRDLFGTEALRPGEEMAIASLTVVFTDLRESTRMYREIGDAPAYGSVSSHFEVLRNAISGEGGAVVKTIGDAVMAVFRRSLPALRGLLAAQTELAAGGAGRPLRLKVGMHTGPCLAVTLNDRLDYFGSTVNVAARLVGLSDGEDVVVSGSVCADPETATYLEGLEREAVHADLKGFDERLELWRLRARPRG